MSKQYGGSDGTREKSTYFFIHLVWLRSETLGLNYYGWQLLKLTIAVHRVLAILSLCGIKTRKQNIYELNSASLFFPLFETAILCMMVCVDVWFRYVPSQCDIP